MSDAIVLRATKMWLDEDLGIVLIETHSGAKQTSADAIENIEAMEKIAAGRKYPMLVDLSGSLGLDYAARARYGRPENQRLYSALALVGSTPVSRMLANMYFAVQRNKQSPTKFFPTRPEAIEWLRQFTDGGRGAAAGRGRG